MIIPEIKKSKKKEFLLVKKKNKSLKELRKDFDNEISTLCEKIKYLDETRKPWPVYDRWIGTPQDKLRSRMLILQTLRDSSFTWKDEYYSVDGEGFGQPPNNNEKSLLETLGVIE